MKTIYLGISFLFFIIGTTNAQEIKETVEPLSKKAQKGYMYDVSKDDSGNSDITFKMKVDKKSDAVTFEKYSFDKNLKFNAAADTQERKEQKEDIERTSFSAYVGGTSSFDVLSMKLKLNKIVRLKTWNHEKQVYMTKKIISDETLKPRNDNGKVYYGYASYSSFDDTKNDLFALAKMESKDKKQADQFLVLMINDKLELKEKMLDLNGSYSLVFCQQMPSENIVMVFAPNKGALNVSNYVYYQFDIEGNIKNKIEFKSPASALLLTSAYEKDGNVYFFGSSTKSKDPFQEVFNEYASIYNPGAGADGNSKLYLKWKKSLDEDMDNFHLLKFSGNQLTFASTTAVPEFKSKFKTAPGDKGASVYKGKNFFIENFFVTASEDYLVAGQLTSSVNMGMGNPMDSYEDILCFHFDKNGNLKAQYGIGKMNNDKKSEIFNMKQQFYPSPDGRSLYWELLEIKGFKGYESFLDAYTGYTTFYPLYFPRIVKIELSNSTLGAVKALGDGKYFLKRDFPRLLDPKENSITYIGLDEDWEKLWIGKIILQ
ncbi:hypothetical protein [Flavobacterium psychrotolerans]|uniref:Uncharacterized protein n=1 Tax=Flavobacterium psychrotolerans TaxID=2169410 RepID=A0A2U1JR45_9FLAO|nr:hypothetical protein [Flavobacterium psychrotolerans]PWA07444.1 hypothetical protein DB895_01630 [Flavobacterium psychrotolerans]